MSKPNKKRIIITIIVTIILIVLLVVAYIGNNWLEITDYSIDNEDIPDYFDGYVIAQISDLHNASLLGDNNNIIEALEERNPNIIVLTGDIVSSYDFDIKPVADLLAEINDIANIFYVSGNHEARLSDNEYQELVTLLEEYGVYILDNSTISIVDHDSHITISGISDQGFAASNWNYFSNILDEEDFNIFLAHRPGDFDEYSLYDFDLILSGHAHGGQIVIPFLGGMFTPDEGFFPEYDAGVYNQNDSTMIISRGIGNSIFPFRINNRPELVFVELNSL